MLLTFLSLSFVQSDAYALSVEVRAGAGRVGLPTKDCNGGDCTPTSKADGSYQQTDLDVLFSPWKRVDTYVGVEYINADHIDQSYAPYDYQRIQYSLDAYAVTFGLHIKPVVSDNWHLYAALGGVAGKAYYKADFSGQLNIVPLSDNRGSEYFVIPRIGIGAVIGICNQISIGIEAAATKSIPAFNMHVININTGQVEFRHLNDNAAMYGFTFGLRYTF